MKWTLIRLPWTERTGATITEALAASLEAARVGPMALTIDRQGSDAQLVVLAGCAPRARPRRCDDWRDALAVGDHVHFDRLRDWRGEIARLERRPAYTVVTNRALAGLACLRPRTVQELLDVPGIGPRITARYAAPLLAITRDVP